MARFGQWTYTVDRAATVRAYAQAERGGAQTCGCVACRNFIAARAQIFPAAFVALLDELGIDPGKDAEVYHNGRVAPGRHAYAGWYHFVGTLDHTGDFPPVDLGGGFATFLCRALAPPLASLKDASLVQLEFQAKSVPWLLDEPEP